MGLKRSWRFDLVLTVGRPAPCSLPLWILSLRCVANATPFLVLCQLEYRYKYKYRNTEHKYEYKYILPLWIFSLRCVANVQLSDRALLAEIERQIVVQLVAQDFVTWGSMCCSFAKTSVCNVHLAKRTKLICLIFLHACPLNPILEVHFVTCAPMCLLLLHKHLFALSIKEDQIILIDFPACMSLKH